MAEQIDGRRLGLLLRFRVETEQIELLLFLCRRSSIHEVECKRLCLVRLLGSVVEKLN